MTSTLHILVVGRHPDIMPVVLRLINQHAGWESTGAMTDEEAMEQFQQQSFNLVLLSSGVPEESERELRAFFQSQQPSVPVIQHYGGGSGLLENEILAALTHHADGNYTRLDYPPLP